MDKKPPEAISTTALPPLSPVTPLNNSEFTRQVSSDVFQATPESLAAGKYNLDTVLRHEVGHLLGIDPQIPGYVAHVRMVAGSAVFADGNVSATLVPQADDLDPAVAPSRRSFYSTRTHRSRWPRGGVQGTDLDSHVPPNHVPAKPSSWTGPTTRRNKQRRFRPPQLRTMWDAMNENRCPNCSVLVCYSSLFPPVWNWMSYDGVSSIGNLRGVGVPSRTR